MSWICPSCTHEHTKQYDEPTLCRACEVDAVHSRTREALLDVIEAALPNLQSTTSAHEDAAQVLYEHRGQRCGCGYCDWPEPEAK